VEDVGGLVDDKVGKGVLLVEIGQGDVACGFLAQPYDLRSVWPKQGRTHAAEVQVRQVPRAMGHVHSSSTCSMFAAVRKTSDFSSTAIRWPGKKHPGEIMPNTDPNITAQVETFTQQLVATVEAAVAQRIQAALAGAFGVPQKRGPGRPPKQAVAHVAVERTVERKKPPKQICPVPGCKNPAAPVFGMVCKDHKNVAKSKIKKYRALRKAALAGAARPAGKKKARKVTPKVARARKLQGQYLGALKSLTGADRAKVKQTAAEKGVAEAVKLAQTMKRA